MLFLEMKLLYVVSRTTTGSPFSLPQLVETTKPIDITAYQPSISGNGKCLIFVTGSNNQWTNNNLCEAEIISRIEHTPVSSSKPTSPVANSESMTTENSVQNSSVFVSNVTAAPNPFITNTNIYFSLQYDNAVKVSLIDITGKVVFESEVQNLKKGLNNYNIDRNNLAAGVYFAIIESGSDKRFVKLIIR